MLRQAGKARQVSINISKKEVCQHFLNVYKSKLNNSTRARLLVQGCFLHAASLGQTKGRLLISFCLLSSSSLDLGCYLVTECRISSPDIPVLSRTGGTKVRSIKLMKVLSSPSFYLSRPYSSYFCLSKPVRPL